eukprot:m.189441 g.189441  ORF g.189441 m.189441 type:complete len:738 (-) comp53605_c0_seq1:112-2325(-)
MLAAIVLAMCLCASARHVHPDAFGSTFLSRASAKKLSQLRSTVFPDISDERFQQGSLSMSVYPSVLQDGEDAVVSFQVPNPTVNDMISVSCGPTNGLGDYLDIASCQVPPPFTYGPYTSITFAVGDESVQCPDNYTRLDGDFNAGTLSLKHIFMCTSKDASLGNPITMLTAVAGEHEYVECPLGYTKIHQDLNEGVIPHKEYIFLCYTNQNYVPGVVDIEGAYVVVADAASSQPCTPGYINVGVNFNSDQQGDFVYLCFKQGNFTIAPPTSVRFPGLLYMRCNYTFIYLTSDNGQQYALDSVMATMADGLGAPKQGHISLTSNDDEMLVSYTTGTTTTPSVRFGLTADGLDIVVYGNSTTYAASDMCDSPANTTSQDMYRNPGYMHSVLLTGLSYGLQYFYQFGNDDDGWSATYSFQSKPDPSTRNVNFLAYADMGTGTSPGAATTAELVANDVASGQFDFLLHFGDISYARGQGWIWEAFYRYIEPIATQVPYMMSIGNHEYDHEHGGQHDPSGAPGEGFHPWWGNMGSDSSGECAVPMYHRVHSPQNGNDIFWYSFNYGPVHVIQMSTEHDWMQGSEQYLWIENDLQNVNRTETPWVILTGHRMMYTTQLAERADYIVSVHLRAQMDDLLYKYQVNAMLVGHQHSYERSCQVYQSQCRSDGTGTVHIIVGTAGAGLETGGFSPALGDWSLVQLEQWGYNRIFATESTLTIQFVENMSNTIFDEVTLHPWPSTSAV